VRRAAVIVLDACGVGELPDAAEYGDAGSNTLGHLAELAGGLALPALQRLGLGSIVPIQGVPPAPDPVVHGRLHPLGPGKESTTGHWELMGVVPERPMPTYPHGFPPSRKRPACASAATARSAAPRCSTPTAPIISRPAR
jgi:phosphopentomutase